MEFLASIWPIYMPNRDFDAENPETKIVQELSDFFLSHKDVYLDEDRAEHKGSVIMDFDMLKHSLPVEGFADTLKDEPIIVLALLSMAVHDAFHRSNVRFSIPEMTVRLINYKPIMSLKNLKSSLVDKFITIRGNVVRLTAMRPLVVSMDFICSKCDNIIKRHFIDGNYDPPPGCEGKCKSRAFSPDIPSAQVINWQKIRVQEIVSSDQIDQGRIPRTIECELCGDLVDCAMPGDVITLSGIVKARKIMNQSGRGPPKSLSMWYIDVNSVSSGMEQEGGKLDILQFSANDLSAVVEISSQEDLFKLLVHSLCPTIYGHEVVKAGLLLGLFGGVQKNVGEKDRVSIRGDPHVLLVGDPGLGKSQMLRATAAAAPRGVYVCGNTTTTTGLTVTMVREGNDFALEAGALVLADQGSCCIDEFDKMNADHNCLLEAMEQQTISIAKAGILCNLSARTSVIAAANPVGGHYDKSRTVAENLKMNSALLSRFDLIFILLDEPDESRDKMLSEHVLALHTNTSSSPDENTESLNGFGPCPPPSWNNAKSLGERLRLLPGERSVLDPLPPFLLRKYIAYARKYVHPRLTSGAREVIKAFYLKLRKEYQTTDSTPITTRQLESLIRLAEARAKAELRDTVTTQDAQDVIDIMKDSLYDIFSDEYGHLDFRRASGMSKTKQSQLFVKTLHQKSKRKQSSMFSSKELFQVASDMHLKMDNFEHFIDSLNSQGILLKRGSNKYQLQSSSFSQ